ncbi:hypothetical protein GQ457_06G004500 [Hibiscus cannabinus]
MLLTAAGVFGATPLLDRVKIWIGSGDEPGRPIEPHKGHIPFVFSNQPSFSTKGQGIPKQTSAAALRRCRLPRAVPVNQRHHSEARFSSILFLGDSHAGNGLSVLKTNPYPHLVGVGSPSSAVGSPPLRGMSFSDSLLDAPIAGDAKAEGEVGDGSGGGLRWLLAVGGCEWFDGRLGEGGA